MDGHPQRDDPVDTWLQSWRGRYDDEDRHLHDFPSPFWTIDQMINEYHERADTGTTLDQPTRPG